MVILDKINNRTSNIVVIGLGYVGLPTALAFSKQGFNVIGLDIDKKKVKKIKKGISPINNSTISADLKEEIRKGTFKVTNNFESAISNSDIIILIVPTPVNAAKEPDLTFIKSAAKSVVSSLRKDQLVILESTVYPGVTEEVVLPILRKSDLNCPDDFGIAYCPERFNPGDKAHTIEKVVRVIGGINDKWTEVANTLYKTIQETFPTVNIKTAETAKVIENIQRDLNIALINEIALICEKINVDIINVLEAASSKWNFIKFLPGPGVGGHCLPHDPYYLVKIAEEKGYHAQVILSGRRVNDEMPIHVKNLIIQGLNIRNRPLNNSKILIFGATYKKNIDDLRTSPTETLVKLLLNYKAQLSINEPNINCEIIFGCKKMNDLNFELISKYDVFVFMVNHNQYKQISNNFLENCIRLNPQLVLIDAARMLEGNKLKNMGYIYLGIGAGEINTSY